MRRRARAPSILGAIVPTKTNQVRDGQQLDHWLDQFVTAESLADFDFGDA